MRTSVALLILIALCTCLIGCTQNIITPNYAHTDKFITLDEAREQLAEQVGRKLYGGASSYYNAKTVEVTFSSFEAVDAWEGTEQTWAGSGTATRKDMYGNIIRSCKFEAYLYWSGWHFGWNIELSDIQYSEN